MTYAELAGARAIKEPAAVRLVQRHQWERQQGNDGATRVAVPLAELRPSKPVAPAGTPVAPDSRGLEDLARERERAERAEGEATGLREGLARERERADRAETREAEARAAMERQERELTAALVRIATAEGETKAITAEAKGLREALEEARRPFWRRLFRA